MRRSPRIKFGSARVDAALERLARAIDWACGIKAVPPLVIKDTPGGPLIQLDEAPRMFVRLTGGGTSGVYNYAEAYPTTGGGFALVTGGRTGTCREWNANATLPLSPNKHVEIVWFGSVGEWRFHAGSCS